MRKIFFSKMKILCSLYFLLFNLSGYAYILEGNLKGTELKFNNVLPSLSGDNTIADWEPVKKLLPAQKWSPGFSFKSFTIKLIGPQNIVVDISDAISVVGVEYRSNFNLDKDSEEWSSMSCSSSSSDGGNTAYVKSETNGNCHGEIYDSQGKMPFYFVRPILKIDEQKIQDAFNNLSSESKQQGTYSESLPIVFPYYYELSNGVKTWQNLSTTLHININYTPGYIADIHLEDPTVHEIVFNKERSKNRLKGMTIFNVIASGSIPDGLIVSVPSTSNFFLKQKGPRSNKNEFSVVNKLPISVECPNCEEPILVLDGVPQLNESIVNVKGSQVKFPIIVKIDQEKDKVALGDYYGDFVLNFGLNL
ncbi:TPA: hypothetical protein ACX6Q7_001398 [Photobacterium damselae]